MDCRSSHIKIIIAFLVVSVLVLVYKYQKILEVSIEVQNPYVAISSSNEQKSYSEGIHRDEDDGGDGRINGSSRDLDSSGDDIIKESASKVSTFIGQPHTLPEISHNQSAKISILNLTTGAIKSDGNFIWIDPSGDFLSRVEAFNNAITKLRHSIQSQRNYKPWQGLNEPLNVLWCNRDDFMDVLKDHYAHVKTVLLKWHDDGDRFKWSSPEDQSNILIKQYYKWSASETLCKWIKTPGYTNARWDAVYNRTCSTNMSLASIITSIEPVYFHGKPINVRDYWPNEGLSYPQYFYNSYPDFLIYMHIIEDALILRTGDIISKNLKLVPYACSQDTDHRPPLGYDISPIYSEVFLVSQFWGSEFFHSMIEGIPRLAPYVRFLVDNPSVLIHVVEPKPYIKNTLRFLGINSERLISNPVRAKVLYVPQATPCGFAQIHELQLLNHLYITKLQQLHSSGSSNNSTVILIRRSGLRKFRQNREVEQTVEKAAQDFDLPFVVFRDDPSPSMDEAMALFYSAILVVAPHGGGLSNVVYSKPGTYVIEGVCNEPHVNMCYQWTSHILGHRYHAIPARRGCEDFIDIEPTVMDVAVRTYLQQIKQSLDKR